MRKVSQKHDYFTLRQMSSKKYTTFFLIPKIDFPNRSTFVNYLSSEQYIKGVTERTL